ncbi:MAG: glycosyltransferase [Sedimentisphaerales bacterium]|nr:glycosyltransferase [Sedimentisphaerales bacterium]
MALGGQVGKDSSMQTFPEISVIVPMKDEAGYAAGCIERLFCQTYPKDRTEILVVDGRSRDETKSIVSSVAARNGSGPILRLLDNPKSQRASAMNIGIRNAKSDVIIRIDARTEINPDYIEKCVETLLKTGADNVGGMQAPRVWRNGDPDKELTQRAIGLALSHPFGIGNAQFRLGRQSGYVDTVYLGCFNKNVFSRVGLFDEDSPVISEDSDMNYRIRESGGRVYFNKDIVAYYYPRDNFKELARLYFRYGGAKAGNFLKIKKFTAWRQLVPPAFLALIVVLGFGSLFSLWAAIAFAFVLGVYVLAGLLVSAKLAGKERRVSLFGRLLVVFPVLHFSWATGFFVRLMQRPEPGRYWGY